MTLVLSSLLTDPILSSVVLVVLVFELFFVADQIQGRIKDIVVRVARDQAQGDRVDGPVIRPGHLIS